MSLLTDSLMDVLNSLKSAIQMPQMVLAYSFANDHTHFMCNGTCTGECANGCRGSCRGRCGNSCHGGV